MAELAERQHGVVERGQLLAIGLGRRAIGHRVERGRLHVVYRGVYAVGHRAVSQRGRWMAAVLASGAGAALSHRGAAGLWALRQSTAVEVTAPERTRSRPGIRLHRARLASDELTTHDGIPATTVARTLLDLASVLRPYQLERAINEAEHLRLTDHTPLVALVQRHPHHRGVRALRAILTTGAAMTRSELEARFLHLIDEAGLPRPKTNTIVEGFECDCVWPDERLIVELDGHAAHRTTQAFERDRVRDRRLQTAGWKVLRLTPRQLDDDQRTLKADLATLLYAARSLPSSPRYRRHTASNAAW